MLAALALAESNALGIKQAEELHSLEIERLDRYLRGLQPLIAGLGGWSSSSGSSS